MKEILKETVLFLFLLEVSLEKEKLHLSWQHYHNTLKNQFGRCQICFLHSPST